MALVIERLQDDLDPVAGLGFGPTRVCPREIQDHDPDEWKDESDDATEKAVAAIHDWLLGVSGCHESRNCPDFVNPAPPIVRGRPDLIRAGKALAPIRSECHPDFSTLVRRY